MGAGLPTDEALRAHAHVEQRAQQYRAAGVKRPIDILRVAAYLDLLNLVPAEDRIARFEAEDADGPGQGTPGSPNSTISLDGRVLPPTTPAFGGVINKTATESTPWWPPRAVPPAVGANVV